jgi:hypothetical protein
VARQGKRSATGCISIDKPLNCIDISVHEIGQIGRLGNIRATIVLENPGFDRHSIAPRPANNRSKITNRPRRMAIDGRSALGRRVRDLAESYAEQLGGWSKLSDMQAASVRCAAEMQALFEQARHAALVEGRADPEMLVRLQGASDRAIRRLGIDRQHGRVSAPPSPSSAPSLGEMISRARQQQTGQS